MQTKPRPILGSQSTNNLKGLNTMTISINSLFDALNSKNEKVEVQLIAILKEHFLVTPTTQKDGDLLPLMAVNQLEVSNGFWLVFNGTASFTTY